MCQITIIMIMNPLHPIIIITTKSEIHNYNYNNNDLYTSLTSLVCSTIVKEVSVDIIRIYQQPNTLQSQENIYSLWSETM